MNLIEVFGVDDSLHWSMSWCVLLECIQCQAVELVKTIAVNALDWCPDNVCSSLDFVC